jgi:FKBP-type peptidyl-prolyl cis-trans isomerase
MNLRILTFVAAATAVPFMSSAQDKAPAAPAGAAELTKPKFAPGEDPLASVPMDKVSYFIGRNIGKQMSGQGFKPDFEALKNGLKDTFESKESKYAEPEMRAAMEQFQAAMQEVDARKRAESAKAGETFLAENAKKKGVTTTASGLQYEVLKAGEGPKPAATDTVKVHYKGTLTNGEEFDSSYARNEPAEFPLNGVIPGWTEGVQLMNKGSKFKFVIPGKLAYGEQGSPPKIGPNEVLVFEVELLEIKGK